MRWAGQETHRGQGTFIQDSGGETEGKRPLARPRRRWEENVNMELQEMGWEGLDWIDLDQDMDRWRALVKAEMNLQVL